MSEPRGSVVVTITMWDDDEGFRGRVLSDDDGQFTDLPGSSIAELCAIAAQALERWVERR